MTPNRPRNAPLLAVLSAAAMACALAQATQSSISGHTYGPDGTALRGTTVWANIVSPLPRPVDRKSSIIPVLSTVTEKDGSFTLFNVPPGDYVLCASNAAVAALNPCPWGGAPRVTIANGLNAAPQSIHMAAAAMLQVYLSDPGGLLTAKTSKPGANLMIGLATPHGFMPLPLAGSNATSREYKLPVPFNTTYNLMISTSYFKLTDSSGVAITPGSHTIPVTIPSGTPVEVLVFQVVGVAN